MKRLEIQEKKAKLKILEDKIKWEEEFIRDHEKSTISLTTVGVLVMVFIGVTSYKNMNAFNVISLSIATITTFYNFREMVVEIPSNKRKLIISKLERDCLKDQIEALEEKYNKDI